jgi:hypothetical protein
VGEVVYHIFTPPKPGIAFTLSAVPRSLPLWRMGWVLRHSLTLATLTGPQVTPRAFIALTLRLDGGRAAPAMRDSRDTDHSPCGRPPEDTIRHHAAPPSSANSAVRMHGFLVQTDLGHKP